MITSDFPAAMTTRELLDGEELHDSQEESRKLAMTVGLTKSSDDLAKAWATNPELFMIALTGAIAAYRQNELVEELLRGTVARLASVVDDVEPELLEAIISIAGAEQHESQN